MVYNYIVEGRIPQMAKKQSVCVSLDIEVLDRLRPKKINLSGELNAYLHSLADLEDKDVMKYDIEIDKRRLNDLTAKQAEINVEIRKLTGKLNVYEETKKAAELADIEAKKQAAIDAQTCKNCGIVINPGLKSHKFKVGLICNACFMSSGKEAYAKWNTQQ
jgi:predicted Zn-ribbon and HTH transcriptional regulator